MNGPDLCARDKRSIASSHLPIAADTAVAISERRARSRVTSPIYIFAQFLAAAKKTPTMLQRRV